MSPVDRLAHENHWRQRSLIEKGLWALGMMALALALPPLPGDVIIVVLMSGSAVFGARVPLSAWLGLAVGPVGFLLAGAVTLMVQIDGHGLSLAPDGLAAATGLTLRALAGLSCLLFLAATTPASDLLLALRRLGVPAEVVELALLMYRFLFLLGETARTMHQAQAARLGHGGHRQRLRCLGLLIANLLPRALDRARRLEIGLAARGWRGDMRVLTTPRRLSGLRIGAIVIIEAATAALGVVL